MPQHNEYGQPIGPALTTWTPRLLPAAICLDGHFCRLEPLDVERHATALWQALSQADDARMWTYLFAGPFADASAFRHYLTDAAHSADPRHYAVIDRQRGCAVGTLALMRIAAEHGVIEVGHVTFSPWLQRTPAATEAHFLLMQYVFETLGYRRYEWKCDSLNAPSRQAALRLGFQYEGLFRQALVYKQRSRDTAWFSILDTEWPALKAGFLRWLAPENFDAAGGQIRTLAACRADAALAPTDVASICLGD